MTYYNSNNFDILDSIDNYCNQLKSVKAITFEQIVDFIDKNFDYIVPYKIVIEPKILGDIKNCNEIEAYC